MNHKIRLGLLSAAGLFIISLALSRCISCSSTDNPMTEAPQNSLLSKEEETPLVLQIARCNRLYTCEYKVHKIVTNDDAMRIKGSFFARKFDVRMPFSDRKIAIPMDATLKAYIDFSDFGPDRIVKRGKQIIVTLPDPKVEVTASKVDYTHTKEYISAMRADYSDEEMANFTRQGLASIINNIPQMGIIEQSRENAARTLVPIITKMGYKEEDIIINFRKHFTIEDLSTIVESSFQK